MNLPADPFFVKRENIKESETEIVEVWLESLKAHVYTEKGLICKNLWETPIYRYISTIAKNPPYGDINIYVGYHNVVRDRFNPEDDHTVKKALELFISLKDNGYDKNNLIVIYKDGKIIRDGQNRAAILYYLYGDIIIKALKVNR